MKAIAEATIKTDKIIVGILCDLLQLSLLVCAYAGVVPLPKLQEAGVLAELLRQIT